VSDQGRTGLTIEYAIDSRDRLVEVNQGWRDFAEGNDAPDLVAPSPERTLWSYISGQEVTSLWQQLVRQVRANHQAVSVAVRCDGPTVRRWFEMTLAVEGDDLVRFRSALVREEHRPISRLMERGHSRDLQAPQLRMCSWCGRFLDGTRWVSVEELVCNQRLLTSTDLPVITHGLCPNCERSFDAQG
jgi:hypothetical protein